MWVGLIQPAEQNTRWALWNRRNPVSWQPSDRNRSISSSMVSSLLAHPANFGHASLHNHVSQFFKINLFSYTYLAYWFCFSGELRLIQVCRTFWVSKDTLDMEGHQITRTQDSRLILTFYMLLFLPCFRFHKEVYCIVQHTQCSYRQSHNSSTVSKYFNLFNMFPLDKNIQEVVIELRNDNQDIYIMQKKKE